MAVLIDGMLTTSTAPFPAVHFDMQKSAWIQFDRIAMQWREKSAVGLTTRRSRTGLHLTMRHRDMCVMLDEKSPG